MKKKRGIYLADPRKQGLAPPDADGLMLSPGRKHKRISPDRFSFICGQHMIEISIIPETHWKYDPAYTWEEQTRRLKDERAAKK